MTDYQEAKTDSTELLFRGVEIKDPVFVGRLDRTVAALLGRRAGGGLVGGQVGSWSRSKIGRLVASGAIKVNGKVAQKGALRLKVGDVVQIDKKLFEAVAAEASEADAVRDFAQTGEKSVVKPENIDLDVVYEDEDLLVVDKPTGMVVHPAYANTSGTLANAVMGYFERSGAPVPRRVGLVHRLDKDVAGLIIIAKNDEAHAVLSRQFSGKGIGPEGADTRHKAYKYYWAVVGPTDDEYLADVGLQKGLRKKVEGYIRRKPSDRKVFEFKEGSNFLGRGSGKYSLSYIELKKSLGSGLYLLEIQIMTGRTHQIRTQLASLGLPVLGDVLYGGEPWDKEGVALRSVRISYIPPGVYKMLDKEVFLMRTVGDNRGEIDKNVLNGDRKVVERLVVPGEST